MCRRSSILIIGHQEPDSPKQKGSEGTSWKTLLIAGVVGYVLAFATLFFVPNYGFGSAKHEEKIENVSVDGDEESESEELDETMVETVVVVIVLLLIFLTIAFEKGKEYLHEISHKNMEATIESLFRELTVLGFLNIFAFLVTKLGFFEVLSEYFFDDEEVILELFEFVHYVLFLIMVSFVYTVLVLVGEATKMEEQWRMMDRACQDKTYLSKLYKKRLELKLQRSQFGFWRRLSRLIFPSGLSKDEQFHEDLVFFDGIRRDFILERSTEYPFEPAENRVAEDFNFGRYLSICLGHTLEHIVDVEVQTWFFFAVLAVIYYVFLILILSDDSWVLAWAWALNGWVLLIFGNIFDFHILTIMEAFMAPVKDEISESINRGEADFLLDSHLPGWCQVNLDKYLASRSYLTKMFSTCKPSRQDSLFWMERHGPHLYLIIFQIKLIFVNFYASLLMLVFYPQIWNTSTTSQIIIYVVVTIAPVILLKKHNRRSIAHMAKVCCIGNHRKPQAISQVTREEKTDRIIRTLVIMQKLHLAAEQAMFTQDDASEASVGLDDVELEEVGRIFDHFDKSGDGNIQDSEFKEVLDELGAPMSEASFASLMYFLDKDGDGEISKQEFLSFYASNLSLDTQSDKERKKSLHNLGKFMFKLFDKSGNGEITLSDLKTILDRLDVGFTIDEIGELVKELDEDNSGMISEEEIIEMLVNHDYLFKKFYLPPP